MPQYEYHREVLAGEAYFHVRNPGVSRIVSEKK